jgi:hypothetical protein
VTLAEVHLSKGAVRGALFIVTGLRAEAVLACVFSAARGDIGTPLAW